MKDVSLKCPWIEGDLVFQSDKKVQISLVAYEHQLGIPARFCIGLVPAIALSKQLHSLSVESIVRVIDPTPIANYCNGWERKESKFKEVISKFLNDHHINFFFDEAENLTAEALGILSVIGNELETAEDPIIVDIVQRIKESGRKHGGESGVANSILYMSAHPFSWLDMYHPLIWKRQYFSDDLQFVNLMSKPESRFTLLRKFLRERRPDFSSTIFSADHYMTVCNTPCYIPLEGEPTLVDLTERGYEWCQKRYQQLKGGSGNHRRALKDFESLVSFVGVNSV